MLLISYPEVIICDFMEVKKSMNSQKYCHIDISSRHNFEEHVQNIDKMLQNFTRKDGKYILV